MVGGEGGGEEVPTISYNLPPVRKGGGGGEETYKKYKSLSLKRILREFLLEIIFICLPSGLWPQFGLCSLSSSWPYIQLTWQPL